MERCYYSAWQGRENTTNGVSAEFACEQGLVRGGISWVIANGDKETVLSALLGFLYSWSMCGTGAREKLYSGGGGLFSKSIGKS